MPGDNSKCYERVLKSYTLGGCGKEEDKTLVYKLAIPTTQNFVTEKHLEPYCGVIEKFMATHVPPSYSNAKEVSVDASIRYELSFKVNYDAWNKKLGSTHVRLPIYLY